MDREQSGLRDRGGDGCFGERIDVHWKYEQLAAPSGNRAGQLGTNERGRAGPGRLQPGGLSPAGFIPRPAVPGAAGKPWARNGTCEAGARQAPGSKESTGFLSLSESAGNLSEWTEFVLTHMALHTMTTARRAVR